ncbi:MAG TPA: sigma 54-interacting transcriptional regulator [Pyrinomonadaceae bacterium]
MKPKIVAIAGAAKGAIFELGDDDLVIGREGTNHVFLNDKTVSRQHCIIKKEKALYKINDLESHNGTLINGVPVKEQSLRHGDHIQVGDNFFLFLLHEESGAPVANDVSFDDGTVFNTSSVQFSLEDALYSMARDLNLLIKLGEIVNTIQSLKALQRRLLESIFEAIPAERGAILLIDESLENPASVFAMDRVRGPAHPVHVSRTVARLVLSEGRAVLSNNVVESDTLAKSESLTAAKIHSLLCVPLTLHKRITGIIYLETSESGAVLNESHLRVLSAIASFVSGVLDNMRHVEWLESENRRLQGDIHAERNIVGESARMQEIFQFIAKVAPTDSTVLLRGESGTGKELVARAIHRTSTRADKPFVAVNCAALTETLLESELFGHEKGSFTGAYAQKKGKFEIAEGGTIFLDEVGEMSPPAQTKLLRVLQEREFERVGGTRLIKANVRVVAATNKSLEKAIENGAFRQDLYYRLNVISRVMPPLRERGEDIPLLASYFVIKHSAKCKRRVTGLSTQARAILVGYHWPGNVRELENAIEQAVVLGSMDRVQPEDLPEHILEASGAPGEGGMNYHEAVREAKKQLLQKALNQAGGSYTEAAKLLGIHPNNLHRLVRNVGSKTTPEK